MLSLSEFESRQKHVSSYLDTSPWIKLESKMCFHIKENLMTSCPSSYTRQNWQIYPDINMLCTRTLTLPDERLRVCEGIGISALHSVVHPTYTSIRENEMKTDNPR